MVILRHFRYSDSADLQKYQYVNILIEEMKDMVNNWNKLEFQEKYFEMLTITSDVGNAEYSTVEKAEQLKSLPFCDIVSND